MELPGFGFESVPTLQPLINVGAGLDVPSGSFVKGKYGEYILNGGMTPFVGVTGLGNTYKTELIEFMQRQMLRRFKASKSSFYDTESNKSKTRGDDLYSGHPDWDGIEHLVRGGRLEITSVVQHTGEIHFDKLKSYLEEYKIKPANRKKFLVESPFLEMDEQSLFKMPLPTGGTIDSISAWRTVNNEKMLDDTKIGEKEANMYWANAGRYKKRLIEELPSLCAAAGHYVGTTVHLGDKMNMDPNAPVLAQLQHLKLGAMKGAPRDYTFFTHSLYHIYGSIVLKNKTTNAPEYPRNPEENQDDKSTDLNEIRLRMLRSKFGPSGFMLDILVSQQEGLLDYLTEFRYAKVRKAGFIGNDIHYQYALLPGVSLSRTTARTKLAEDAKLRRVANITCEIIQQLEYHKGARTYVMDFEQLYQKIIDLGYDWDQLLATRGWWTYDNDKQDVPFLSSRDILEMAHERYVPYWLRDAEVPDKVKHLKKDPLF